MTIAWTPNNEWVGATVAVLGCGPSMSAKVADALRAHRRIVVNAAHRLAPDADMLVALDGNWPQDLRDFAGLRVTGVADDDLDALYAGPMWERVLIAPNHEIEIRNSGLAAIRIAAAMGASRIIIAGFDPERPGHFYDDQVDTGDYAGLAAAIAALTAELALRGVTVDRWVAGDGTGNALPDLSPGAYAPGAVDLPGNTAKAK